MANTSGEGSGIIGSVALFMVACGVCSAVAAASLWPLFVFGVVAVAVAKVALWKMGAD